ncbi:M15 family metallopeptidase [Lacinutrix sp. C3R15]|uniref:M15 family metallopeptidase n=1 Tax=Flavobacteriaceae TaxID=49546 RepID=UPI001C0A5D39|nr:MULTISPECIES: M15 family metallopeptidase [Flavobacteriaceae]MBU2939292.1 M15 family metallopeptidase [Lacinutrix sp. C3R15]MDO6622607.1 M15 family metallopeptidase [Oceanihabitans sp. 1_MG-2023]
MKRRKFIKTTALSTLTLATIPNITFAKNTIAIQELIGKGNPKLFGDGYALREAAHFAFIKMKNEALKEGISIQIVSSYRSFNHQKSIWERKYKRYKNQGLTQVQSIKKIINYSTIPGTSRHHWATDIDIIDANVRSPKYVLREENFHNNGAYIHLKKWMDKHANSFGFYLVYTKDAGRKGFKYEPWHYSYKPLSQNFLKTYKKINIQEMLEKEQLLGNEYLTQAFLKTYLNENILDINPDLL